MEIGIHSDDLDIAQLRDVSEVVPVQFQTVA